MTPSKVKGIQLDSQTRCAHYHSEVDIIAIKFHCCNNYYACYYCHKEMVNHSATKWPKEEQGEHAILCGSCQHELTIHDYMNSRSCPTCSHPFNEKCSLHFPLYFET
ncbi:CHY zinc finger protein [Halobacillus andaensis]|uniref:CHY zinc finger protein n=1 Tax=Halobacillus andaensis TaxID=1176239 RepID=UPI00166B568B|nr:CHY zinc finger protein [Halobacillus andaensis]MBP2004668.1 putative CHY-type Zn-finger protein [Halobacillus andaensis]